LRSWSELSRAHLPGDRNPPSPGVSFNFCLAAEIRRDSAAGFVLPELDFRANSPGRELRIFLSLPSGQTVALQHTQFLFIICSLLYDGGRTNRLGDAAAAALIHLPVSG
jgi:hypothetical protein